MKFKLVKVSISLTVLRPVTFLLIFLPLMIGSRYFKPFLITTWEILILVCYFLQKFFIKRYKVFGYIAFRNDFIEVEYLQIQKNIPLSSSLKIIIFYSSYKNQHTKGNFSGLSFEEGINKILIQDNFDTLRLNFLSSDKEDYENLNNLVHYHQQRGINIQIISN